MHRPTTLITAPFGFKRFVPAATPAAFRHESPEAAWPQQEPAAPAEREFKIESADSFVVRQSANALLQERYGWRGYQAVSLPADQTVDRTTLTAMEDGEAIGTITVGLDSGAGMSCEQAFPEEVAALRRQYGRVCEFTKLAVDPIAGTHRVLAGLFHVAFIIAHRVRGYDAVVMEVNPRHVRFYERMLGGRVVGAQRTNRSVGAPAVLLAIPFAHVAEQIELQAGRETPAANDRSLYALAFTPREEQGIIERLIAAQKPVSEALN